MAWNYIDEHNNDDRSNLIITNKESFCGHVSLMKHGNLLKRDKEAHRAIAEALIERGYLSHEECKRLYGRGNGEKSSGFPTKALWSSFTAEQVF